MNNDEKMEMMYQMMGELHGQNLEIVFKGALVLEHIMMTQTNLATRRKIHDFEVFLAEGSMEYGPLCESYEQYAAEFVENPPEFNDLYGRVRDFCGPFFTGSKNQVEWIPSDSRWTPVTFIRSTIFNKD